MKKVNTLKKNYEFRFVIKKGKFFIKKHIIVYLNKNNKEKNFIGIAINARFFNAVKRNKIKRLVREAFYRNEKELKKGYNIVFLWNKKSNLENVNFRDINNEIKEIFKEADIFENNNIF